MRICVYGASSNDLVSELYDAAFRLGELIAAGGDELVFGGGDGGLMGACARGALSAGGAVTGIAPELFNRPGVLFAGCTEMIYTKTMSERKALMADMAQAYIALPGGLGTYDELFETLTLKQLGIISEPIALLNTLTSYIPLLRLLDLAADGGFMGRDCMELFAVCDTPGEALKHVRRGDGEGLRSRSVENYIR